jgi:hypothetical protein
VGAIVSAATCPAAAAAPPNTAVSGQVVNLETAHERVFEHPASPYAVIRFPEDALGEHIGVIYYGRMAIPNDGAWSLDDRFWQDKTWSSDVTSFAWANDGRTLFVGTSEVYGTGCVYRLDLMRRKAKRIYPSAAEVARNESQANGFSTVILAIDEQHRFLKVRVQTEDGATESIVKIP